ncbi:hypothetical protein TPELB_23430 [Terrisporobacter petrolearius]|uniref:DUF2313 domain-containing protein n=1 Tax=Terrisporobacter petrolearius TaxID=1460447 RepID=A0ABZ3FDX7_9FIRM
MENNRLLSMLPFLYHNSDYIKGIQNGFESERLVLEKEAIDFYNNLFVDTASWSLEFWESLLGVKSISNDINERRNVIKNKLKFRGITNFNAIKELCSQYGYGEIEINEKFDEGKFIIRFISKEGEPDNIKDLIAQINSIIPAHVGYDFNFTYMYWKEIKNQTWKNAKEYTWNSIRKSDEKLNKKIAIPGSKTIPGEIYPSQGVKR